MATGDRHTRLPRNLSLFFSVVPAIALVALAADTIWGGGHPPLGAVLASWALYPTLTGYLSQALLGDSLTSLAIMLLGFMEYPLVGFGLGSVIARSRDWTDRPVRVGLIAFLSYVGVQLTAHALLNTRTINTRLMSSSHPSVSRGAIERTTASGDAASLPILQEKFLHEFGRQRSRNDDVLLDAVTQLGGAKGWQDLLDSGRLGVKDGEARTWRYIINNVREMTNPLYAAARGGVHSPYLRDEDVGRLIEALARKLAEHLEMTPDSEASLTLLTVMKGRPDLCANYLHTVPNGLRERISQATYDVAGTLAAIKGGHPPDSIYNYHVYLSPEAIARIGREQTAVADEWTAWATANPSACQRR
jgi:hypothetical protein